MKVFLIKIMLWSVGLAGLMFAYARIYDSRLEKAFGPNTRTQITQSFQHALTKQYNVLFLGNSRVYRGINPDSMATKAYNFAHDDDSYNQMYYKLLRVTNEHPIDVLFLGVDYFSFSYKSRHRNYIYGGLLGDDYVRDFYDEYPAFLYRPLYRVESWRQQASVYMGMDRTQYFTKTLNRKSPARNFIKPNGQYIFPGVAKKDDSITRDHAMLPFQLQYFNKILDYCEAKGIKVFLLMPPVRENELRNYPVGVTESFDRFFETLNEQDVDYLNYSKSDNFALSDFTDITHLNAPAADRFTVMVSKALTAYQQNNKAQ